MSGRPEVSVVAVACDRRDFIAEALASVRAQDLDPDRFEVILCTNLPRPSADSSLEHAGLTRLDLPAGNWGEWVRAALPHCHADVLCFLDDDDLFESVKLSSVRSVFQRHPSVGYYHNRVQRFGDAPSASFGRPLVLWGSPDGPMSGLITDREKNRGQINRLFWDGGGFNASAIAVRREVLDSLGPLASELEVGHPLALFYAAALGGWDLYFDPAPLTRYRVHSTNRSVPSGSDLRSEYRGAVERGGSVVRDSGRIARFIDSHRGGSFASAPVRSVGARARLLQSLSRPDLSRTQLLRELRGYLSLTPARILSDQRGLLALVALGLAFPRLPEAWLRGERPTPH